MLDLQVNVTNLLNYDDRLFNGTFNRAGTLIPHGFKYPQPRAVRLTATLKF